MNALTDPVHFSNLKKFSQSPAHYLASIGGGKDFAPFRLGRATHALILGAQAGGKWDVYDGRRAGKEWEAFKAARPNTDIFSATEMAQARAMAAAVAADPLAKELLQGEFELPVAWTDECGRKCETRGIDVLNRKRPFIVDLKTAQSAHPGRFAREAIWMGYHAQGAFYIDAARSLGVDVSEVYIIAVEKKAPYAVTVLRLTARAIEAGRRLCRSWMEQLLVCEAANAWPAYSQSVVELDIPDEDDGIVFGEETEEAA